MNGIAETEQAVSEYLSGVSIPESQKVARRAYLSKFYYRIDGKASERCAQVISDLISPPAYHDLDQENTAAEISKIRTADEDEARHRPANRLKDFLGINRSVSLRFWRTAFSRRKTLPTLPRRGITAGMATGLYAHFEKLLSASGASSQAER